jgi:hypothetical protein
MECEPEVYDTLVIVIDLNLQEVKKRTYSQSGEDGIIGAFVNMVYSDDDKKKILVCEFGAHDGSNSNLLKIVEESCIYGVFIECDELRFNNFKEKYSFKKICVNNISGDVPAMV